MICKSCGAEIKDTALFCNECGAKVIKNKYCPNCGSVVEEKNKFCNECGFKLIEDIENIEEQAPIVEDFSSDIKEETNIVEDPSNDIALENPKYIDNAYEDYDGFKSVDDKEEKSFNQTGDRTLADYDFDNFIEPKEEYREDEKPLDEAINNEIEDDNNLDAVEETKEELVEETEEIASPIEEEVQSSNEEKEEGNDALSELKRIRNDVSKNDIKIEKTKSNKIISIPTLAVGIFSLIMLFMPWYRYNMDIKNYGYINGYMHSIHENDNLFLNPITFFKIIKGNDGSYIMNDTIHLIIVGLLIVGFFILLISNILLSINGIKLFNDNKCSKKVLKYIYINIITMIFVISILKCNSVFMILSLLVSLGLLVLKFIFEADIKGLIKNLFVICSLGLFIIICGYVSISADELNYSGIDIGHLFDTIQKTIVFDEKEQYMGDLIKFLGWVCSLSIILSMLIAMVCMIKSLLIINKKTKKALPAKRMVTSIVLLFLSIICFLICKNICNKYTIKELEYSKAIILPMILCAIVIVLFYLLNIKIKSNNKKQ